MAQPYEFEKLFLAKGKDGKQDVCVETCPLVQHQLDGIRFLYRAWIKKMLGVILNDPSGYGKRVQTTLFLSAVLPSLDKSVLILCKEGNEQLWVDYFQTWTKVSGDVHIELNNPLNKKKILIVPSYAAAAFARRDWAMLVLDGDLNKELVKCALRAHLKVWIASANIKKDLSQFSTFFSWVHPKEKFPESVFKGDELDLRDVLNNGAMLDAYMEDMFLRRSNLDLPYTRRIQVPVTSNVTKPIITVSRKNKDSTGTKIKRTKRKTTDQSEGAPRKNAKTTNVNNLENTEVFEMGILNRSSLDVSKGLVIHDSSDDDCITSSIMNKRNRKSELLDWDSDSDSEIPANKANAESGAIDKVSTHPDEQEDRNSPVVDNSIEISGQSEVLRLESDTDVTDEDLPNNYIGANNDTNVKESDIDVKLENEVTNTSQDTDEIKLIENNSEDLFSTDFTTANEMNKLKAEQIIADVLPNVNDKVIVCENNQSTDIFPSNSIEIRSNQSTEHKPPETKESKEQSNGTDNVMPLKDANLSEFDLRMKKLEEMALKKFKGSFLDSIF